MTLSPRTVHDERPEDELTGADAIGAMHDALVTVTTKPDHRFVVTTIRCKRVLGRIVVRVEFLDGTQATLRIAPERVRELRDLLADAKVRP